VTYSFVYMYIMSFLYDIILICHREDMKWLWLAQVNATLLVIRGQALGEFFLIAWPVTGQG